MTSRFLDRAREDARSRSVEVDDVRGDVRELAWEGQFDAGARHRRGQRR
ncbi:MAG: hypothetical protein WD010_04025 [Nitriliruptor sp.]